MRLAVLSDVHGNAFALEAVLQDIQRQSPDTICNLGDAVWGGADPARAWQLQLQHAPPTVRGNTDELVAGWHEGQGQDWQDWLTAQLPADAPARLGALPTTALVAGGEVLLAHGDLHNTWEALMMHVSGPQTSLCSPQDLHARLREWTAPPGRLPGIPSGTPPADPAFPGAGSAGVSGAGASGVQVVVVGHTHREAILSEAGVTFVNAGSVSRQFSGDPAARWVLLEKRASTWNVTFHRTQYDLKAATQWALTHCFDGQREAQHLQTGRYPT